VPPKALQTGGSYTFEYGHMQIEDGPPATIQGEIRVTEEFRN
jgi:hypothetical protein